MSKKVFIALPLAMLCQAQIFAATVRVEMIRGHEFSPSLIEIQLGDTVEFVNTTSVKHTVTADPSLADDPANVLLPEGALPFDSGKLDRDQVFSQTFSVPGLYQYICLPHESHMKGQVKVVAPTEE